MAVRIAVDNTRRTRADTFPNDTPEPVSQPYGEIDELLQLVLLWIKVAAAGASLTGFLAFFFPSFLVNLFR